MVTLAQVLLAPALVGLSALAARRWDATVGGLVSALPAIVGPVLLILAHTRGERFAADTATGTLAGLAALAAFVIVYARACDRRTWPAAVAAAIQPAATAIVAPLRPGLPVAAALAAGSLGGAYLALPARRPLVVPPAVEPGVGRRMALTAGLVAGLAAVAPLVGPLVGGMLTALPVLACILAAGTHRAHGSAHVVALLRGMLTGMAGFVLFCVIVAALTGPIGFGASFLLAAVAAMGAQALGLATQTARRSEATGRATAGPPGGSA